MENSVHSASADTFQSVGSLLPVNSVADRECEQHGAYQEVTYKIAGRTVPSGCPHCIRERDSAVVRVRLDNAKRQAIQSRLESLFKQACVPRHYWDASFDNYDLSLDKKVGSLQKRAVTACQSFAENFDVVFRNGGNLVVVG
jgi:DNA replication protein DnaC